ncbi:hypothetical protein [Methylocystis sp.]|jgi:two-component system CheB/CheR fusion protein|uniref:hypothetical protein n=1 Tax=Methylocystis sp. TaxID=1911079 RepID=UPI003DA62530
MGHDFSGYKKRTFIRRVHRRMQINHCDSLRAYVEFLQRDHQESARLFRDLLINVTNFFRDAEAFDALEKSCSTSLSYGAVSLEEVVRQALAP